MKHSLQLKFSQNLTLTPQLQQSIHLLQLSTLELNEEIEDFLSKNPLLEKDDDPAPGTPTSEEEDTNIYLNGNNFTETASNGSPEEAPTNNTSQDADWFEDGTSYSARDDSDESDYPQLAAEIPSLRDHLNWQLNLVNLENRDRKLISLLIDALDDDGYLTQGLEELAELLPEELEVDPVELQIALKHLQNFDPIGVGARNLSECLALQLEAMSDDTPFRKEALVTVREYLDMLGARDFTKLRKNLNCDDTTLREIQSLILHLNPRPGANFSNVETRYIVPDVVVKKIKGVWTVSLNPDAMPKLRINRMYADILQRNRDSNLQQLTGQLQEAKWLIKNVRQRFETILRVAQAIVDRQRHFFEHGEVAMRPLVLREIAETLNLHESTISRVKTHKYMLTPRGIFELGYFFGSHVATETGGACSAKAIRALIKQMVASENAKKPLSDSQISEILSQQGIVVARRTIAKYREALHIPPVNLRKSL